ncbi:serine/threonine-protein kinase greatwall-like [Hydractinia symbiolongicarpus]|uniref:serine/threonine-protein kinase greatwall-like n=1 Tax=Hydractinia symbiolongicarpus TaxID=13093 RepID=UPI00254FF1A2|nr:serine/threonine-protein kinase greatwall-like [Hydractinia symbiolongicarpus]
MAFSEVTKKHKPVFDSKHLTVKKSHAAPGINDFEILKPISRGAFGQVYLARKKGSRKLYALKAMKKCNVLTKNMMEQVVAERDALAISSKSPFVVQLYYSFQSDEKIYLVMEYMIGGDIKSLLHNLGYFEEHMATFYIAEVVLALEYLHSHAIFHRDIKPDNMLLSNSGHVKLTDFGLSCLTSERKPNFMDLINTPGLVNKSNESNLSKKIFWRTPGQLQSLTSNFTFSIPKKTEPKKRNMSSLSIIASTSESKDFIFSPPQMYTENSDFAAAASMLSTPRNPRASFSSEVSDSSGSYKCGGACTGLTADITSLALDIIKRKRSFTDLDQESDEKENFARGTIYKRARLYSQSLPCELETSTDDIKNTIDESLKIHSVHFADQVQQCGNKTTDSPQIVLSSHMHKNPEFNNLPGASPLPHEISTNNISGVTALTETSHMSISLVSECVMLSPHNDSLNKDEKEKLNKAVKFTPSPSQTGVNFKKDSPSLTPKSAVDQGRKNSESIKTPIQMLRFCDGISPELSCFQTGTPNEISNYVKKTPDGNLSLESCPNVTPKQTPFRTPKSCLRGKATPAERKKILGTPDYLAPEILLEKNYGAPVDFWALGVCFYEFLTGIPPFNDDTAELVFEHILDRDLIWPEGEESLSQNCVDCIEGLLTVNPEMRPKPDTIKEMHCFDGFDWKNLPTASAPFIPQPDDVYDTTYFEAKNVANKLLMSAFKP